MINIMAIRQLYKHRELTEIQQINGQDNLANTITKRTLNKALETFINTNQLIIQVEGQVKRGEDLGGLTSSQLTYANTAILLRCCSFLFCTTQLYVCYCLSFFLVMCSLAIVTISYYQLPTQTVICMIIIFISYQLLYKKKELLVSGQRHGRAMPCPVTMYACRV